MSNAERPDCLTILKPAIDRQAWKTKMGARIMYLSLTHAKAIAGNTEKKYGGAAKSCALIGLPLAKSRASRMIGKKYAKA
jgi:hypothetical protein